jgi:hypothetical protein
MEGTPALPVMVAMVFVLGLLWAFHGVVSDSKPQAELRHKATALRAMATFHCNGVPEIAARDRCLLKLSSQDGSTTRL